MPALLLAGLLLPPSEASGAEPTPASDVLQQKTEEVERLRRELEVRERELDQLRAENERLRREQARGSQAAPTAPQDLTPAVPIQTLPPLTADTVVEADELVRQFLAEPEAAARRYADRTFRVRGEVARFDRAMVAREFSVMLASPDRTVTVKFRFNYVDQYHSVFTAHDGRDLVARYAPGSEATLLKVGEAVVLGGRCQGLKNGSITFTKSEIVR